MTSLVAEPGFIPWEDTDRRSIASILLRHVCALMEPDETIDTIDFQQTRKTSKPNVSGTTKSITTQEVEAGNFGWVTETLHRLGKIAVLPENWDEEGSPPPSQTIIAKATFLIHQLQRQEDLSILPAAFVCPISGGGIQFEWTIADRHLELEFVDEHTIAYLTEAMQDGEERMDSDEYSVDDVSKTRQLLGWLVSSKD